MVKIREVVSQNIPITIEFFDEFVDVCPKCKELISKQNVVKVGQVLSQTFKCKNKKCKFEKTISMRI